MVTIEELDPEGPEGKTGPDSGDLESSEELLPSLSDPELELVGFSSLETPQKAPQIGGGKRDSSPPGSTSYLSSGSGNGGARRFDERLFSKLSLLKQFQPSTQFDKTDLDSTASSAGTDSQLFKEEPDTLRWSKMGKISERIYSRDFKIDYGEAVSMTSSGKWIAIGTSRGYVLIYDNNQNLIHELNHHQEVPDVPVTCLAFSLDSTYVAAGFGSGLIMLWDGATKPDEEPKPVLRIDPITAEEVQRQPNDHREDHLAGVPIVKLSFVGARHTALTSVDETGVMIGHQGSRTVIGYKCVSKIMMGKYQLPGARVDYSHAILEFSLLPIGSQCERTDEMGVMAIITPKAMIVISTTPTLQTHFKVGRPKVCDISKGLTGAVAWFPGMINRSEHTTTPPLLAYCWANVVTLFEVNSEMIKDHFGSESTMLKFENKQRWVCTEPIVSLQWLNGKVLTALTKSQRLVFLGRDKLAPLSTVDMISKHIRPLEPIYKGNKEGLIEQNYNVSYRALRSNVFALGKSNFYVGTLNSWIDMQFAAIKDGRYVEALQTACDQYEGNCDLTLLGLPQNDEERHKLMKEHITQILEASLNYLFSNHLASLSDEQKQELLSRFLNAALKATTTVAASKAEGYETLYETYADHGYESLFFDQLEKPLLNGDISTVSAPVLRKLVEYYVKRERGDTLEELLCSIDITHLDIDMTIRLCKKHHLDDAVIYIWNVLLADYITPVFDGIRTLKKLLGDPSTLTDDELEQLKNDAESIYTYITYVLTGRQYPTDRLIPDSSVDSAKLNVYYLLFNGASVSYPASSPKLHISDNVDEEPAFPYLFALLKHDSFRMLTSLNEAFEDELLNDDSVTTFGTSGKQYELKVNRQYIIDVLLGIYRQNAADFTPKDKAYMAIFVARNYPKYSQFIRLSDGVLDEIIETLCAIPSDDMKEECELSLQSLLSVYKPANYDSLIPIFESCGFYDALLNVYRTENKYLQLLELWVKSKQDEEDGSASTETSVALMHESLPSMTRLCFEKTKDNPVNQLELETLIRSNFTLFIKDYPEEMAEIFALNRPPLNSAIFSVDDEPYKYRYLKQLVTMEMAGELPFSLADDTVVQYASLLSRYNHDELGTFVLHSGNAYNKVMALMDEHQEVQIMIDAYQSRGEYFDAIDKTVRTLNDIGNQILSHKTVWLPGMAGKLTMMLSMGFKVVKGIADNVPLKSGMTVKETLQLKLVESAVNLFTQANQALLEKGTEEMTPKERERTLGIFKTLTQDAFQDVLGDEQDSSDSFMRIFFEFLHRSSLKMTTLGDVRPVLNEVFLSYSHDEVILNLILKLLNDDIYKDLVDLEALEQQGWSPMHLECEMCGKKIWGSQISSGNYESWRDHKLGTASDENKDSEKPLEIYVFQCRHAYHTVCLEKMGMTKEDRYCILCREEEEKQAKEQEKAAEEQEAEAAAAEEEELNKPRRLADLHISA